VADAQNGDSAARAWLSKHLIGEDSLILVAVVEEMRSELNRVKEQFPALPNGYCPAALAREIPQPTSAEPACVPADPHG
jgi:hypothetical protein